MQRQTEHRRRIRDLLRAEGAKILAFGTTGHSHQKVQFEIGGRRKQFSFSSTPGNPRTMLNDASHLRRVVRSMKQQMQGAVSC